MDPPITTTAESSHTKPLMSLSHAPTPSRNSISEPLTASRSWALTIGVLPFHGGTEGVGIGVIDLAGTATRPTGADTPATVNHHTGTVATPRLVRSGALPNLACVTSSVTQPGQPASP